MPARLRPTRLEHVVDGLALRSRLAAALQGASAEEKRERTIDALKQALSRGRLIAKERLENGAGGVETAQLISGVTDEVITTLFDITTTKLFRGSGDKERLTLLAVGGYGRGVMAPFSDIDLLFLRPAKQTEQGGKVIEFMLHALWDLGFKVGHASRTMDECIKLAREDFTIRTALLEMRFLAGEEKTAARLIKRFREEVVKGTAAEFVAAKLKERDQRHDRDGSSRYLVEPNVKEGKGALRDLHTLAWIAEYLHPVDKPDDVFNLDYFDRREVRVFLRAFDFLHAVRAHLHFATGRAEERLSFDLQPEIARRMGYGDRGDAPAVERFMRRYFLIAKEVGALTRAFSAKLEGENLKKEPRGLSRFLPVRGGPKRRPLEAPGFVEEGGRLNIEGPEVFETDPVNILRLFKIADERDLDLHPDAFTAVNRALPLIGAKVRRDREAAKIFLDVLARGKRTYSTLTLMNDSGVLGRYIPEFGRVVAQMQFNMYHSYTVDEHTLRAVGVISDIANGRFKEDHPLSTDVMPLIDDRESLFLAMLLHDTGKGGAGGQEKAGARAARSACERMGLERSQVELVAWLVEHHLVMSDTAQKRDVTDPKTAVQFARIVESPERLRLLLVLTTADIRAVGPGVFNGWKGQLMRELYTATEAIFRGRGDGVAAIQGHQREVAAKSRAALIEADPVAKGWAVAMDNAYFTAFSTEEYANHAVLGRRAAMNGGAAAEAVLRPDLASAEVTISARDRRGLFADFAMAIAGLGGNIVGARVFTSRQGWALDVFYVQSVSGAPFGADNPRGLKRLAEALESAGRGQPQHFEKRRSSDLGRTAAFAISPTVVFDNEASEDDTVIEASGRDRPGLLEALARTLSGAQLSIQSAHIDGYGERATDVFYVQTASGEKLTDARRIASVKTALTSVLDAEDPSTNKRRLARAPASVAR